MIWSILVGAFIGMIAGLISQKSQSMGCISKTVSGLIGSVVGQSLFGQWGPTLAGMSLIPSILGAIIVIALVSLFFGK